MSSDPLLMVTMLLLFMTGCIAVLYYRRIKETQEEYEDARGVVKDIVISFNKQVQRQKDTLDTVAYKMKILSSKSEGAARQIEAHYRRLVTLEAGIKGVTGIEGKVFTQFEKVEEKVEKAVKMQEALMQKIAELEKFEQKVPVIPEEEIETVIPLRKEKALAPLTETELTVLEILATEGGKTAPEIKMGIQLSREHTSRLMRKLYENGYLERDTRKTPYTYRLKKEMEKILKSRFIT